MNELTRKQKGFVKDYIETDNATEAIVKNYPNVKDRIVAKSMGSENLAKPYIQKAIAEMLPDDLLGEKHLALLNKADKEGNIDVQAVSKGLDMAYKVKGSYAPEKQVNLNLNGDIIPNEELESLAKQLNDIARNNKRTSI
jgi:phage terminase small subunit